MSDLPSTNNYRLSIVSALAGLVNFQVISVILTFDLDKWLTVFLILPFLLLFVLLFLLTMIHWFHYFWNFDKTVITTTYTGRPLGKRNRTYD